MKDTIKENFSEYLDNFFESSDVDENKLKGLLEENIEAMAILSSIISDCIVKSGVFGEKDSKKLAKNMVVDFVEMCSTFGVIQLLTKLSEQKGGNVDEQGTIN